MKTQKSSPNEEVTPSKKVLRQSRLPFKIITDASPKSVSPQPRKRKLSAAESEPVTKVVKITKENDLAEPLVISDDDSKESLQQQREDKKVNPYVKLVDTAWKKKLQKKTGKKKKGAKKTAKSSLNTSNVDNENAQEFATENGAEAEKMDVDEGPETDTNENVKQNTVDKVAKKDSINSPDREEIIELEDSSCSIDTKKLTSKDSEKNLSPDNDKKSNSQNETDEKTEKNKTDHSISLVTPKSDRSKSKTEDLNSSIASNCDESFSSDPSTPRRSGRNVSITNSQGDVSLNESATNLTPKQLQRKMEFAKKREEKEKERLEREKKRQLEKEERAKQRQEKEDQKKKEREEKEEVKKKEREEKEEQKRKEKEEREKQKELEKKLREEKEEQKRKEKEEKEEQRKKEKEAREEERRKKQEALEQEKLEQEQKKKKAAEAFVSFFVPKQKAEKEIVGPVSKNNLLSSFTLKSDMRLAPTTRNSLSDENRKKLEDLLIEQKVLESSLYIKCLKNGVQKPLSSGKTWPVTDKDDDDVMIVEDELPPVDVADEIICDTVKREKLRPKLLAFHENKRPPYWGTWRKRSSSINPRRPFQTDEKLLDYEVDSDEEWEEEQDGESIDGSVANSDDDQDADEYEVDNEVFVPHGYLSDEEATMDEDDVLSLSPETQKARLKHLEDEFESELKKPMEKLKPRLYGLLWETADGGKPEKCLDALWNYFGKLSMILDDPTPLLQPLPETEDAEKKKVKKKKVDSEQQSPKSEKKKKKEDKEGKKPKAEKKQEKKNQPGINTFLKKITTI